MSKGHSDSNYAWWQWLSVTDVWWSLKWWEVCRCGMCEKWDEMWCKAMWSPLSWISDSVDFWSCGKATTLVQHYIIKRKLIELLCTNKWQQSTLLEGDDSSWEQCYDSNISPTYRGCPVGLRMSNSVWGMQHFALSDTLHPTWASVPMFSFCYKSNISLISCGHPVGLRTSDSVQWPRRFCIIRQLVPNSAERSDVFPFITFHLSFFQIYFHHYLAYLISDISPGTCI